LRIVTGESAETAPVLLAGADAGRRAVLRAELGATLPSRTRWVEADAIAETLERATFSRMVILAGDLDDADVESLTRLLGRRHPELPVICVDAPAPAPAPAAAGGRG
jgi:DNA-binding NtrC family response regulator